jgi:hypothetical protein
VVKFLTDHTGSRVIAFGRNSFTYWAGASWSLAGEIADAASWHETERRFRKRVRRNMAGNGKALADVCDDVHGMQVADFRKTGQNP